MTRYASMLTIFGLICLPSGGAAQDTIWNRYTLEDLGGVFVSAETGAACAGAGVTDQSVRVQAEAALAAADVELLTQGEMLRNPGLPELRILLECTPGDGVSVSGAFNSATIWLSDSDPGSGLPSAGCSMCAAGSLAILPLARLWR